MRESDTGVDEDTFTIQDLFCSSAHGFLFQDMASRVMHLVQVSQKKMASATLARIARYQLTLLIGQYFKNTLFTGKNQWQGDREIKAHYQNYLQPIFLDSYSPYVIKFG